MAASRGTDLTRVLRGMTLVLEQVVKEQGRQAQVLLALKKQARLFVVIVVVVIVGV